MERRIEEEKRCKECGKIERSATIQYSCDACGNMFSEEEMRSNDRHPVRIHEHWPDRDGEENYGIQHRLFCNFRCMFRFLSTVDYKEEVSFGMPYVGMSNMKDFLASARDLELMQETPTTSPVSVQDAISSYLEEHGIEGFTKILKEVQGSGVAADPFFEQLCDPKNYPEDKEEGKENS